MQRDEVRWMRWGLLGLVVMLAACQTRVGAPSKEPLESWLTRTQGVVGVFPPREDVRVGDVHLYLVDPESGVRLPLYAAPRWSHLPSSELQRADERLRPPHPMTPPDYLQMGVDPDDRSWPEPSAGGESGEAGPRLDRLRAIALPPFAHYRSEPGELLPSWGLHEVLEESYDDWDVVRVQIESAELAGLALGDAVRHYLERRGSSFYVPASLRQNLRALAPDGLRTLWVRIVTEVIYMRAMRVTVVSEPEVLVIDDDVSAAELGEYEAYEEVDDDGDADYLEEDLDPAYGVIARAAAMNRKMVESGTDVLPNGFVRFLSVSDEATTARRVFRRPLAIGVGGLSLRVDARTGEVEQIRLMGRELPAPESMEEGDAAGARAIDAEPLPIPEAKPEPEAQ